MVRDRLHRIKKKDRRRPLTVRALAVFMALAMVLSVIYVNNRVSKVEAEASYHEMDNFATGQSAYNPKNRAYVEYYATLDPHNPDVIQFFIDRYSKVAEIPEVDYVQLDYIRYADVILSEGLWDKYKNTIEHEWRDAEGNVQEYPGADYCYCDDCVKDFKERTGIDIREAMAKGEDVSKNKEWAQFRCDVVTNLVNKITEAC